MPTRPRSHSERQSRAVGDAAYYHQRRRTHGPDPRSTARWRQLREVVLSRDPLCCDPFGWHVASGRVVASTDVDHIVGIWARPDGVFDEANLQGLCKKCHSMKSSRERQGNVLEHQRGNKV